MMHHDNAVTRKMHVELETIGARRERPVERRERILRRDSARTSMCEHERRGSLKKRMLHVS